MYPRKWLPLAPNGTPGVYLQVERLFPRRAGSYYTQNVHVQHVGAGPASPGTTLRAWCALLADDTAVGYIGTSTKLYLYDGASTFTDKSSGAYGATTDWNFAQYGNITFATNRTDAVQTRDSSGGANFAAATGSPPKARIVVTQSDQVLLFDLNDGAEKPDAFAACAPGDHTDWSGAGATTATRIRHRPGKITAAIAFRDYVLVFKQSSVYRLTYTGNNTFKWKVELIAIGRGAFGKNDVVNCGDVVVFNGPGGAWTYDGASFRCITEWMGEHATAVASLYTPGGDNVFFQFSATYFSGGNGVNGRYPLIAYNVSSDRWGQGDFQGSAGTLSNAYRLMTGEAAALRAFVGTNRDAPDLTEIVNLSVNPCVLKSTSLWGNGSTDSTAGFMGSVDGRSDGDMTIFTGLHIDWTASGGVGNLPPGNGQLTCTLQTGSAMDYIGSSASGGASATAQRRFKFNVTVPYARPVVGIPANTGYGEIADYHLQTAQGGGKLV